jgi:peptide/nickel transport system permease protein
MTRSILALVLRALVVLAVTALATFTLLWNAPGDPALAIAMARYDALVPPKW